MFQYLVVQVLGHIIDLFPRKISIDNKVCNIKQTIFWLYINVDYDFSLKMLTKMQQVKKYKLQLCPGDKKPKSAHFLSHSYFYTFLMYKNIVSMHDPETTLLSSIRNLVNSKCWWELDIVGVVETFFEFYMQYA